MFNDLRTHECAPFVNMSANTRLEDAQLLAICPDYKLCVYNLSTILVNGYLSVAWEEISVTARYVGFEDDSLEQGKMTGLLEFLDPLIFPWISAKRAFPPRLSWYSLNP